MKYLKLPNFYHYFKLTNIVAIYYPQTNHIFHCIGKWLFQIEYFAVFYTSIKEISDQQWNVLNNSKSVFSEGNEKYQSVFYRKDLKEKKISFDLHITNV